MKMINHVLAFRVGVTTFVHTNLKIHNFEQNYDFFFNNPSIIIE